MPTPGETLRAYLDAGDRQSYAAFAELLHDDLVAHGPGGVTEHGVDAEVRGWQRAHGGLADLRHEVVELVAQRDTAAARVVVTGRHEGPFLGVTATGGDVRVDQAVFARLRDGRIAELWHVVDTGTGLRQLGVLGDQPLAP